MNDAKVFLEKFLHHSSVSHVKNVRYEAEGVEYAASQFEIDSKIILFRKGKKTPKKEGVFVTFWKRDEHSHLTQPYHEKDPFDFLLVAVEEAAELNYFLFPKSQLIKQEIVSTATKEGKRGFRLYPPSSCVTSLQALKSQKWHCKYYFSSQTTSLLRCNGL